jgi:hypothetical protein
MAVVTEQAPVRRSAEPTPAPLMLGLGAFAVVQLGLAVWMAAAPRSFFDAIGPFDTYNPHYIRDVSTYNAALGVGFLLALRRPAWRIPVLATTAVQFALHSVNHLIDIDASHPAWVGYFDFFALAGATVQLAWLLTASGGRRRPLPTAQEGGSP